MDSHKIIIDTASLYTKRKDLRAQLVNLGHILKGSVVKLATTCGKPNCRCKRGQKHVNLYLSTCIGGKTRIVYLSPTRKKDATEWVTNYHKAHEIMNELAILNAEILKRRKPR